MRTSILRTCLLLVVWLLAPPPAATAAPVVPPDPDWGWLFDDGTGRTAAAFRGGADAQLVGGAGFDAEAPFAYPGNGSLLLDGVDGRADVPSLAGALEGASAFSLSLWLRSDAVGQNRAFFAGTDPGNQDLFGGRYDEQGWLNGNAGTRDLLKFGLMIDGTNVQIESSGGLQRDTWQHVLFTWESGAGARLYVDGVLDAPSEATPGLDGLAGTLSDQPRFLLGDGAKAPWQGRLDEVMVWRTALGPDHAAHLSSASLGASLPVPEPGTAGLAALGLLGLALFSARLPRSALRRAGQCEVGVAQAGPVSAAGAGARAAGAGAASTDCQRSPRKRATSMLDFTA